MPAPTKPLSVRSWLTLFTSFVILTVAFAFGLFCWPAIYRPLTRAYGWNFASQRGGSIVLFLIGVLSPFVGASVDQFKPKRVILAARSSGRRTRPSLDHPFAGRILRLLFPAGHRGFRRFHPPDLHPDRALFLALARARRWLHQCRDRARRLYRASSHHRPDRPTWVIRDLPRPRRLHGNPFPVTLVVVKNEAARPPAATSVRVPTTHELARMPMFWIFGMRSSSAPTPCSVCSKT